jgi:hypothetical protein
MDLGVLGPACLIARTTGEVRTMSPMELKRMTRIFFTRPKCDAVTSSVISG